MSAERMHTLGYQRWQKMRAMGLRRFVLERGVLVWGGLMTVFFALVVPMIQGTERHPLLAAAISLPAGALWALATWYFSERHYRSPRY